MSDSNGSPLSGIDTLVGNGVEAAVRAKHAWRLRRLGWDHALAPPDNGIWATGDPPPREGCALEVLVDGAAAFPRIAEAIANARDHVHVTGWHIAPYFELIRGERGRAVGELLAEAAERVDVRVLVWAGAPVPAFHPTRKEVRDAVEELTRGTRIRCEADPREHPFHCHHEKTVVLDGEVAFVGGIDMTDYAGDRFDVSDHPARRRLGWHDVGTRLRGPAVKDVHDHFELRWRELTGERLQRPESPPPAGEHTVQVVRTVAENMYEALPTGDFRVLESYLRAIRSAERFVYLENQFLWAPEIVSLLGKVGMVDDRWLTIGSANLNAHSLFNDTEMNVVTDAPDLARDTRLRLWSEHLGVDVAGEDPSATVDQRWRPIAFEQLERLRAGAEPTHRLIALPGLSKRSRRLLGPLVGLVDDG